MAEENIKLSGTLLISAISPYNSTDKYPTHYAKYGHGGYRSVNDITELNEIPQERIEEGMLVYVKSEEKVYIYKNGAFGILEFGSDTVEIEEKIIEHSKIVSAALNNLQVQIEENESNSVKIEDKIIENSKIVSAALNNLQVQIEENDSDIIEMDEKITENSAAINELQVQIEEIGNSPVLDSEHNFTLDTVKQSLCIYPYRKDDNGNYVENNASFGNYSTTVGYNCKVEAGGANSFCGGDDSVVYNEDCFVYGKGLASGGSYQTVLGKFNKALGWDNTIPLVIGWGENDSNRKNLLVIQDGINTSDPNANNSGGLMTYGPLKPGANYINDFSEYFEWFDGNPTNEDRVGYMVQLNGEKIELADSFEKCIGIISVTSAFVGNSCSLEWHGKYLKDDFGRIIYEEIEGKRVPKINPNYDDSLEYIPRDRRKEWGNVGILGQILVRQDGTLKAGDYAGCLNGFATKSTDNKGYRVLKIVSDKVALVLVK